MRAGLATPKKIGKAMKRRNWKGERGLDWIADAHGGAITVTSQSGQGSTFHVTVPGADAH